MIKDFVEKIKATKRVASQKNVFNWYNCVFHSLIIIMGTAMVLSLFTIIVLADVTLDTTIGELLINMQVGIFLPILYAITLSYLFLEKLILVHIHVYEKVNRYIFKGWQKFDMWYYRKYRKTSPLTESLAKIQQKIAKHNPNSKRNKRIVLVCVIAFFILLNISVRMPIILDYITAGTETETEIIETDYDEITEREPDRIIIYGGGE